MSVAGEVHLFDADKGCLATWKRHKRLYGSRLVFHIEDITGVIADWTTRMSALGRGRSLDALLDSLEGGEAEWMGMAFDGIVSLNVLGQIPLYWRDRVLAKHGSLGGAAAESLSASMGRLQEPHIRAVSRARSWSAIITDREYLHYDCTSSGWNQEPALFGASRTVLEELYPANRANAIRDTWWWHVVPQFVECDESGCIHVVEARAKAAI
jgi:hypothetical protein